ncbi:MAG: tetratricopeptide repeat protein [Bacteroidia bacterium]
MSLSKIQDFINESLQQDEMDAINEHLKNDELEAERVCSVADALEQGKTVEELKQFERVAYKKIDESSQQKSNISLRIAAAVIILFVAIGAFYLVNGTGKTDLYASYYEPYENVLKTRGNERLEWATAMMHYDKKEYAEAKAEFLSFSEEEKAKPLYNLYLGIVHLELDELENAGTQFRSLLAKDNQYFNEHAKWYLSLLALKTKNNSEAIEFLNQLTMESNFYKKRAQELLDKLGE